VHRRTRGTRANGGVRTSSVRTPVNRPTASPVNPSLNPSVRLPADSASYRPLRGSTSSVDATTGHLKLGLALSRRHLCPRGYVPGAVGPSRSDATTERNLYQ